MPKQALSPTQTAVRDDDKGCELRDGISMGDSGNTPTRDGISTTWQCVVRNFRRREESMCSKTTVSGMVLTCPPRCCRSLVEIQRVASAGTCPAAADRPPAWRHGQSHCPRWQCLPPFPCRQMARRSRHKQIPVVALSETAHPPHQWGFEVSGKL